MKQLIRVQTKTLKMIKRSELIFLQKRHKMTAENTKSILLTLEFIRY